MATITPNSTPSPLPQEPSITSNSTIMNLPEGMKPAQLETIDLFKLQSGDATEKARLLDASIKDGFFYLDLTNPSYTSMLETTEKLYNLSESLFGYNATEKALFDVDKISPMKVNGYKPPGRNVVNKNGDRDGFESWVLPRNGIMKLSNNEEEEERFPHPYAVATHMPNLKTLMRGLGSASQTIFTVLSEGLSLSPEQQLQNFHDPTRPTPDILRLLKYHASDASLLSPTTKGNKNAPPPPPPQTPHTDMGSLTFVFSKVPGLQILPAVEEGPEERKKEEEEWLFVSPLPGHAVVNLGDCMSIMTNGTLKSALHRVGPLPGMAMPERYSFAYLMRPEDSTPLRVLDSPLIEKKEKVGGEGADDTTTCGEWMRSKFGALRGVKKGEGRQQQQGQAAGGATDEFILTGRRAPAVAAS